MLFFLHLFFFFLKVYNFLKVYRHFRLLNSQKSGAQREHHRVCLKPDPKHPAGKLGATSVAAEGDLGAGGGLAWLVAEHTLFPLSGCPGLYQGLSAGHYS